VPEALCFIRSLINLVTNLAYFGAISVAPVTIADNKLGFASALVPVVGCMIIGLRQPA
jgi:chloride channel protein, CIC family